MRVVTNDGRVLSYRCDGCGEQKQGSFFEYVVTFTQPCEYKLPKRICPQCDKERERCPKCGSFRTFHYRELREVEGTLRPGTFSVFHCINCDYTSDGIRLFGVRR